MVEENIIKESNNMEEEKFESVGALKVKDVRETKEEIVEPDIEDIEEDIPDPEPKAEEEEFDPTHIPIDSLIDTFNEDPGAPVIDTDATTNEEADNFKKVGTARLFNAEMTTVFRFDIYYKEYYEGSGTIEYRNIIDNFDSVRPSKNADLREFFAIFGIIRWNFPKTVTPVNTNVLEALLKIECLINNQIIAAGIKKGHYEFRVDTVE